MSQSFYYLAEVVKDHTVKGQRKVTILLPPHRTSLRVVNVEGIKMLQLIAETQTWRVEKANIPELTEEEQYIEEGGKKFYVCHTRTHSYTALGANNHHHAFNKASKLWSGLWSYVTDKEPSSAWTYVPVKEFNAIVKEHMEVRQTLTNQRI
jgi:hypothetical protein